MSEPAGPSSGAPGHAVPDAALRRLHPATTIVELPASLKSMLLPLVAVFVASSAETTGRNFLIFAAVGAGLSLLGAILRYVSTRYGLVGDHLVIRTGILFKRRRSIPVERVQNIDLKRGVFHRMLGVAEVKVETAGSEGSEAHLRVVGTDAAELFRSDLLRRRSGTDGADALDRASREDDEGTVLRRSTLLELVVAGATENRAGLIIGSLFGLTEVMGIEIDEALETVWEQVSGQMAGLGPQAQVIAGVAAGLLLVFAGWVVSIVLEVTKHFGFTLRERGDELRCAYGLFTRIEAVVPRPRLQVLRVEGNPLHRLLGVRSVCAETAGTADEGGSGGRVSLTPMLPETEASGLCRAVLPEFDLAEIPLQPVHPLAVRRALLRFTMVGWVLMAWPVVHFGGPAWIAPAAWLLPAWAVARWRYRTLRWAHRDDCVVARTGLWTRRLWLVPESKVQSVSVTSSPFQRRYGLATLHVHTAGTSGAGHARIADIGMALAQDLREALARASNKSGLLRGGI